MYYSFFLVIGLCLHNVSSKRESMSHYHERLDIIDTVPVNLDESHELIFSVPQKNIDKLETILRDVSDVSSRNYGKHWSTDRVGKLIRNRKSHDILLNYLSKFNVSVLSETVYGEYVTTSAPISIWNQMFGTSFYNMKQKETNGVINSFIRAESYEIPLELCGHVDYVLNIIELPVIMSYSNVQYMKEQFRYSYGFLLPRDIRKYYNIKDTVRGSKLSTQSAFATGNSVLNPNDLKLFQNCLHFLIRHHHKLFRTG